MLLWYCAALSYCASVLYCVRFLTACFWQNKDAYIPVYSMGPQPMPLALHNGREISTASVLSS